MARVLVTGARGFLGRYAVASLADAGWSIIATGRRAPDLPGIDEAIEADLTQDGARQALVDQAQADVLLHLAWTDDPRARWHTAENVDWAAVTLKLARDFAKSGGRRIVFGSSCAVYDFAARAVHCEADSTGPNSLYGAAKASTGALLNAAQDSLGVSMAEARMFFCYGAGEPARRLVPDLIAGLSRGEPVPCTDGQQKRDYLHAADIGRALALICGSEISGPVNVASGRSIRVADLIAAFATQMGHPDLPELGAIARSPSDPADITADVTRLQALGFRPNFDLDTGVAETISREARRGMM